MFTTTLTTFAHPEVGYVVHTDSDGNYVPATPGPITVPLTYWSDVDLASLWGQALVAHRENSGTHYSIPDRDEWWEATRRTIAEGAEVEIVWCADCCDPHDAENTIATADGAVCSVCHNENYRCCEDCDESVHYDRMNYVGDDRPVCNDCIDSYSYCEDCDMHYHSDDESEHRHGGCDCAPPTYALSVPNGTETLTQDQRVTVGLPAGTISDEAIQQIAGLILAQGYTEDDAELRNKWWNFHYQVPTLDSQWQTKDGNYTKRLSKLAYKTNGLKVPAEIVTKVGNIARDNSKGVDFQIELTRQLNLPAEDFYHEDSCWWQSYSESRCSLKSNGGIGMRSFNGTNGYNPVTGRAWIQPLRNVATRYGEALVPTFDGMAADAYVVYNGYGDLSGYTPARILAGMVGMSYRKIELRADPQYVNGNGGYLVAPEAITARYINEQLELDTDEHSSLYLREQAAAEAVAMASA